MILANNPTADPSIASEEATLATLISVGHNHVASVSELDPVSVMVEGPPDSEAAFEPQYSLPNIGELVDGTYRITEEISRGAMGVVVGAFDEKLQRDVATKWIRSELLRPGFIRRFLNEAQAMARVAHPHVVRVHAFGQHQGAPYFVMERIEGQTLEDWLKSRLRDMPPSIPVSRASQNAEALGIAGLDASGIQAELTLRLRLLEEICSGVAAIHAAGTVHRDLKPSNILLDASLRCLVADFGVSTLGHASDSTEVGGTLPYMAPEMVLSFGTPQPASAVSDIYSLGCIAHELLTLGTPARDHRAGISGFRLKDAEPAPLSLHPTLPASLSRVIQEALHPNPTLRTQSVELFQRGIKHAMGSVPDRILIAEDDDDFREILRDALLRTFPTTEIVCAANGEAALNCLEHRAAAVAIVDLQMPNLDGASLTQALRKRPETANMPIIVLSGTGGAAEWQRLSAFGADRFLLKPVNLEDIVSIIEHTMRERTKLAAC